MKNLAFASIGLFICSFSINAQTILTDDFDSGSIDTNKWQIILPFNNQFVIDRSVTSAATQNSGSLTLKGGASINSKANIVGPYQVSGIFNQSSPGGRTIITLRGDGVSSDPVYGNPNGSVLLFFFGDSSYDPNYKCNIGIASSPFAWNFNINEIYRDNNFPLLHDNPTSFNIIDWGSLLEININDKLISRVILPTGGFGNSVTLASQWSDSSGLQIDSFKIESVPEPSALSLLAVGLGGLAMFLRRRRCILPILCLASLCLIEKVNCQTLYETINPNLSHQIVTIQNNASVPYDYKISIALTSQSDWLVFLNAKARLSDPFGLFKSSDFSRTQNNGIYTYSLLASGTGNNPVRYINLYDAYRYVNWIENGADENADTEDGAYSLIGLDFSKGDLAQRNVAAKYYIQNMREWYGALGVITTPMNYYEWTDSTNYYGFPVYMYAYALYDNGLIGPGAYADVPGRNSHPGGEMSFRIASVPEPSALSLLAVGLGGLAILRRRRS